MKRSLSTREKSFIATFFGFVAFLALIFIITFKNLNPVTYLYFNEKRTAEMEEMYGITVTGGVELVKYQELWMMQDGTDYRLTLRTDDYESLVENIDENISGKLKHRLFSEDLEGLKYNVAQYSFENMSVYVMEYEERYEVFIMKI